MTYKKIYKDLYFDDAVEGYVFIKGGDRKYVTEMQSYLLIYIIELLNKKKLKIKCWKIQEMIKFCPNCNKSYIVGFDTTDYVHQCNSGNPTLDREDVLVIGDWEDYTGSGKVPAQQVMRQGMTNELFGTRPKIEYGEDKNADTRRGVNAETHRKRQHQEFIDFK